MHICSRRTQFVRKNVKFYRKNRIENRNPIEISIYKETLAWIGRETREQKNLETTQKLHH